LNAASVQAIGGRHEWALGVMISGQSKFVFLQQGGRPEASLPEHVTLGKFNRGVSLLAWGYNEELLIESFLTRAVDLLHRTVEDWEIVFVDDCSTDTVPPRYCAVSLHTSLG
jgi:hypothetical protein